MVVLKHTMSKALEKTASTNNVIPLPSSWRALRHLVYLGGPLWSNVLCETWIEITSKALKSCRYDSCGYDDSTLCSLINFVRHFHISHNTPCLTPPPPPPPKKKKKKKNFAKALFLISLRSTVLTVLPRRN